MNVKQYSSIFLFGALAASAAWYVVLTSIDPVSGGASSMILFYTTFALMVFGWLISLGTILRALIRKKTTLEHSVKTSIRQAALLTVGVIGALLLQRLSGLTWWAFLLIVIVLGAVEFFAYEIEEPEKK